MLMQQLNLERLAMARQTAKTLLKAVPVLEVHGKAAPQTNNRQRHRLARQIAHQIAKY